MTYCTEDARRREALRGGGDIWNSPPEQTSEERLKLAYSKG